MPDNARDSELVREGRVSYHQALFAVFQFRRQVDEIFRAGLQSRMAEVAKALKLDEAELGAELTSYAEPANYSEGYDGSEAQIGVRVPKRHVKKGWGLYFYLYVADGESRGVYAHLWLKQPGSAIEKLAAVAGPDLETEGGTEAWIFEQLTSPDEDISLPVALDRVLDRWFVICKKVGGLGQFLPKAKAAKA